LFLLRIIVLFSEQFLSIKIIYCSH